RYAYAYDDGGVYVVLYGSSTVKTPGMRLRQNTAYPWDGAVTLTIEAAPQDETSLRLRIPGWCTGAAARVNGTSVTRSPQRESFFEIRRRWSAGDTVQLGLPMPARLVEAHPLVEEARNH